MFNKKLLVGLATLGATASVSAVLQEKIAANTEKIAVLKKDIKDGKVVNANQRCQKCGNSCNAAVR